MIKLSRKCYFSSGVRRSSESGGQGYNYTLELTLLGDKDPVSGLVINLTEVDATLKTIVAPIDHVHLDDAPESPVSPPASLQSISEYLWEQLEKSSLKALLWRMELTEGEQGSYIINKS